MIVQVVTGTFNDIVDESTFISGLERTGWWFRPQTGHKPANGDIGMRRESVFFGSGGGTLTVVAATGRGNSPSSSNHRYTSVVVKGMASSASCGGEDIITSWYASLIARARPH